MVPSLREALRDPRVLRDMIQNPDTFRVTALVEAGLYDHWLGEHVRRAGECQGAPSATTTMAALALHNLWVLSEPSLQQCPRLNPPHRHSGVFSGPTGPSRRGFLGWGPAVFRRGSSSRREGQSECLTLVLDGPQDPRRPPVWVGPSVFRGSGLGPFARGPLLSKSLPPRVALSASDPPSRALFVRVSGSLAAEEVGAARWFETVFRGPGLPYRPFGRPPSWRRSPNSARATWSDMHILRGSR
ncbi:hypothetical protein GWK47_007208 [Chionoecetes opilio]|uniref:Uncharacterized protein n=1 Tax=Chionoecetes opilio TaxID=41210 RepID=A0A8J4YE16_CHIOP|nr:hypothetical protein GWK47_007208 [Chionoecetes opilio]